MKLEVVWTPSSPGASEPILKAFDGEAMRKTYAYHRTADGRRYFLIEDSEKNRELVKGLGSSWALKEDTDREEANKPAPAAAVEPDKRALVVAELTRLGIAHKSNMKLEALINRLPVESRSKFA